MKKDRFKKMKLQVQTLDEVERPECCALLLVGFTMETPEVMEISMGAMEQTTAKMEDGTLEVALEAKGIKTEHTAIQHMRTGKQAEILDYNYFKSRLPNAVITNVEAELFDFRQRKKIPFSVKKLEFMFSNGKKVDFTDRVSVISLSELAS
ncbi:MAG: hypothetical protein ACLUFH_00705 [Monoglobales bacterium]